MGLVEVGLVYRGLAAGGTGSSAVRGRVRLVAGGAGTGSCTACCMTAGVSGSVVLPLLSTAGVIRSCGLSSLAAGVSRLARRSMMELWTIE